jgi:hypothetical protein
MSANTIAYPFDPTGVAPSNRVQGERQVLTPGDWKDFFCLIPSAAPYFGQSLVLIHHPSERTLIDGVDYAMTHRFHDASLACGKPIFGSFTLYDQTLTGTIEMRYQTLGGVWTQNQVQIQTILANRLANPRITTWEQVANIPYQFPVIDHQWNLTDMVGMSQVVAMIQQVALAIQNRQAGGLEDHRTDYNNPHQVTKAQVGLGNVLNCQMANLTEAEQGLLDDRYMSPLRTRQAIILQAVTPLNNHADNRNNPHQVTKEQVGLSNVANFGLADVTLARTGTNNASYMTPLTTAAAIDQFAILPLNAFIARRDNPNAVTKAQVGLGNVQNFPIADTVTAQQGVSTSHYMTPATTRVMMSALVGEDVTNHVNNLNNPHQTNKAQIGLGNVLNFGIATQQQAIDGTANDVYMTPLRTSQLVQISIDSAVDSHANDTNNPHLVTKLQVGLGNVENYPIAQQSQATQGLLNTVYMTPLRAKQAFDVWSAGGGGGVNSAHLTDYNNPHQVTPAQIGAYSTSQVDGLLSQRLGSNATAVDSARLGGLTYQQVLDSLPNSGVNTHPAISQPLTNWTYFGSSTLTNTTIFTIYGGSNTDDEPSVVVCEFSPLHSNQPSIKVISGDFGALEVGYVIDVGNSKIDFFLKAYGPRAAFSVHLAVYSSGFAATAPVVQTTEPVNYKSFTNFNTSIETTYQKHGHIGQIGYSDAGELALGNVIEEVNVVTAANVTAAQIRTAPWADIVDDMSPLHFYRYSSPLSNSSDRLIREKWVYDSSVSLLQQGDIPRNYLKGLYSAHARSTYTVEAKFSSANTNMQGGLGLCAALVERNGKYYSIDILRTPGGMLSETHPGSSFFKLITVGLNLFRNDTANLGSTSNNQLWGDGVLDSNRAGAGAFVPTNHGWSNLGEITIRVEKTPTVINIYVSQPNAVVGVTPTVTIDLTTPAMAAIFGGRPTRYGIIASPNATDFSMAFVTAPEQYRPYVTLGALPEYGGSSFSYYNGQSWTTTNTKSVQNPYLNRLIHSEIDGTVWRIGRSGMPRQLYIAAQATSPQTVLTT